MARPTAKDRNQPISDTKDAKSRLAKFKASVVRSIKQYNAGQVKIFDDIDDFLNDLHSPE